MAIQLGQRLGLYEILSTISAGGKGAVDRPRDTSFNHIVQIRVFKSRHNRSAGAKA